MTFAEYTETWRNDVLHLHSPATRHTWESMVRRHLLPAFGAAEIQEITPAQVQQWVRRLDQKYAPKTVHNIWAGLRVILTQACQEGLLPRLPAPKLRKDRGHRQAFLTLDHMQRLIRASEAWKPLCWLLAETGLRIGEVVGLRIEDIAFEDGTLEVARAIYCGRIVPTKTASSERVISISSRLQELLLMQLKRRERGWVFGTSRGTPASPGTLAEAMVELAALAGVEYMSFHAWRHGNRTLMLQLGVPDGIAEQRIGHKLKGMAGVYCHAVRKVDKAWVEKISDTLASQPASQPEEEIKLWQWQEQ